MDFCQARPQTILKSHPASRSQRRVKSKQKEKQQPETASLSIDQTSFIDMHTIVGNVRNKTKFVI
ncbi:hypothetical protein DHL47_02920 [Streptococcus panodentis]|uniref:Uncharacterized protein n=1 Tax=Streptococcus panodentis TaxID=1581472 RepID=A0ABS5AX34_9STRE|nr:hypothetical protein STRDD11_00615 [Streptococcus sp. DD11]MBP2620299.1 hypothetical protein [Streptococcus panodentis]